MSTIYRNPINNTKGASYSCVNPVNPLDSNPHDVSFRDADMYDRPNNTYLFENPHGIVLQGNPRNAGLCNSCSRDTEYDEFQFSSVTATQFQTGATGNRARVIAVGIGNEEIVSYADPIIVNNAPISIKTLFGGIITDIAASLSISTASTDLIDAIVHVQLYSAKRMNAKEFLPIPNTLMQISIPQAAPVGSVFSAELHKLHIKVEPDTQLLLGFYSTSTTIPWSANAYLGGVIKIKNYDNRN